MSVTCSTLKESFFDHFLVYLIYILPRNPKLITLFRFPLLSRPFHVDPWVIVDDAAVEGVHETLQFRSLAEMDAGPESVVADVSVLMDIGNIGRSSMLPAPVCKEFVEGPSCGDVESPRVSRRPVGLS